MTFCGRFSRVQRGAAGADAEQGAGGGEEPAGQPRPQQLPRRRAGGHGRERGEDGPAFHLHLSKYFCYQTGKCLIFTFAFLSCFSCCTPLYRNLVRHNIIT